MALTRVRRPSRLIVLCRYIVVGAPLGRVLRVLVLGEMIRRCWKETSGLGTRIMVLKYGPGEREARNGR